MNCSKCGSEKEPVTIRARRRQDWTRMCPDCGHKVKPPMNKRGTRYSCPKCGSEMLEEPKFYDTEVWWVCQNPYCGHAHAKKVKYV